jgi:hypothetical protein
MTALEELTREFEDAADASAIIESLLDNGLQVRRGIMPVSRGYTGARLAKAQLANVSGQSKPHWCVIKYCPPVLVNHQRESRRHTAALQEAPRKFRERHLTKIAFPPIPCPSNALVIGQSNADGISLGTVGLDQLADACEVVWKKILVQWASPGYDSEQSTLAELLACELDDSFRPGGWLHDWAQVNDLLVPAFLELEGEESPLPNPWRLFVEDLPATRAEIHYLVGRTHGDLHGDNVLIPVRNGTIRPADEREFIRA